MASPSGGYAARKAASKASKAASKAGPFFDAESVGRLCGRAGNATERLVL